MKRATGVGIGCLVVALATWFGNVGDTIIDLREWHQAETPHILGVLLKQTSTLLLTLAGGVMLPQPWRRKPEDEKEES